jgi:hypothetical protein
MCRSAEAQCFLVVPLRAAARGLKGQRCSGKKIGTNVPFFLPQFLEKKNQNRFFSFFKLNSAAQSSTAAAQPCTAAGHVFCSYRCSACVFLALQRSAAAPACLQR